MMRNLSLAGALLAVLAIFMASSGSAMADADEVGLDAITDENDATSLGTIEDCVEVANGDEVAVDLYVKSVDELIAWQMWLAYDPAVLEVADRDVELFLGGGENANVFDASDQTPDSDGRYFLSAANLNEDSEGTSGSGVLARITFTAVGTGISELDLRTEDLNSDDVADRGPFLRDVDAQPIGDDDDDTFFDGTLRNAAVAVDADCGDADVTVSGGDDGSSSTWVVLVAIAAVLGLVGVGAAVLLWNRRRADTGSPL
jgi:hypothetical protein